MRNTSRLGRTAARTLWIWAGLRQTLGWCFRVYPPSISELSNPATQRLPPGKQVDTMVPTRHA
ncbi:hypothetical protein DPMN_070857 [Dreissena polymorpha]|uniref:Secreted protein n=1 Tax=Dreissena polymorpha TaxID=45954 RepID=A0A9D3Z3T2_DREPO|nr:hypothetical protein DPMN_070857 [Dreissena polymorpha]